MSKQELLEEIKAYTSTLMADLAFHNMEHTMEVAAEVRKIGKAEGLSDHELFLTEVSAWFHDIGYNQDEPCSMDHEDKSIELAREFLKDKLPQEDIDIVSKNILATKLSVNPSNKMEEVISDADLSHLGKDNFYERSEELRQEFDKDGKFGKLTKKKWFLENVKFLCQHKYCTEFAKDNYRPEKEKRVGEIMDKLESQEFEKPTEQPELADKKKKKDKGEKPRRDIETMYRILARNQMGLSAIADRKASILLSINSIITSFAIGYLFRKLDKYPELTIPAILFALTGLVSVILAVFATRPNVKKKGEKPPKDKVNLLFFENFVDMSIDEYKVALKDRTKSPEQIYESLSTDSYYLGKVLDIKYRRLRLAFNFFMVGLTVTVVSFIIAFAFVQ